MQLPRFRAGCGCLNLNGFISAYVFEALGSPSPTRNSRLEVTGRMGELQISTLVVGIAVPPSAAG